MSSRSFSLNPSSPVLHLLMALSVCTVALSLGRSPRESISFNFAQSATAISEGEMDARLQNAAVDALGQREGTIIVLDVQTGRIRAVANPTLASEQAFPPGSTIKPFTALAGLQSHLISNESRLLCRGKFAHEQFSLNCAHPKISAPFDAAHALAYSCNYFFGELGQRLSASAFTSTLASFGFGERTGFGANESVGKIPRGKLAAGDALGEGDNLLVTPLQLLAGYAALVNGGHLYDLKAAPPDGFAPHERAAINISPTHRAILIEGMRGAVEYGTATRSGFGQLPLNIFAKTGTATEIGGYRTNGWFVGFAADEGAQGVVPPDAVKIAVLVFLKHSHGAECAEVSKRIFYEFARLGSPGAGEERRQQPSMN